jgi:excisionase family DNA binding protein
MADEPNATGERWLTADEAATHLGYKATGTLYNKLAAGEKIPHRKLGRSLRFRASELDAWIEAQNQPEPEPATIEGEGA